MSLRNYFHLFVLVLIVLYGCKPKGEEVPPEENTTKVGDVVIAEMKPLVSKTIGEHGGELELNDVQSSLNGFKITVPSGAYAGGAAFSVSAANVVKHGFGDEYKVLSPLISISAPSGYIDEFVTIEIPIKLPENHFAAAILVDGNGLVDVLPVIAISENKLEVAVNSFSRIAPSKGGRIGDYIAKFEFLVASLNKSELLDYDGPVEGAFKPGVDDWAFANRGSVLEPSGYCSGSAMSTVWYFTQRKKITNIPLHELGASSNAPVGFKPEKFEEANSLGIKYVSLVQKLAASRFDKTVSDYMRFFYFNGSKAYRDNLCFFYASYCLRTLKRPLLIALKQSSDLSGGHMITIIGKKKENLMLADPNYPGKTQLLTFDHATGLKSFKSAPTAENSTYYDTFFALPIDIFNKDISIQAIWDEGFDSRLVENSAFFPAFTYSVKSVKNNIIRTSLTPGITNKIESPFLFEVIPPAKLGKTHTILFAATGDTLKTSTDYYVLPPGKHKIGVLVKVEDTQKIPRWADFRWFDVEVVGEEQDYNECQITTAEGISVTTPGETGKEYTFSLGATCSFPQKTTFFWDFGDGTTDEALDKQVTKHKFSKGGDFTVQLRALPPGTANYVVRELKIRISDTLPQYFVRFTVGSNEYLIPRYAGDAISFTNHTYGSKRESWPSLFATYDDRKGGLSYSAFLSIDFYNNAFKGVGNYSIAAPLDTDIMLSPYASRTEFYTSLPSKGAVVNAYINSFADPDLLGRAGGNVKITKYEKGNIIEGTFEFVADEYVNGRYTLRNQTITGSFRIRPLFDN